MKKIANTSIIVLCLFFVSLFSSCNNKNKSNTVLIKTNYGNIKVKLYDLTPLHKDNFLNLVDSGYYDGTIFHRVIKDFMIQGGDPNSKGASKDAQLGMGGPDYTIPAEILPELYHKKGALAAARQGDQVNPEKRSSGSQFYIVQGKVFTNEELDQMEQQKTYYKFQQYFRNSVQSDPVLMQKIDSLKELNANDELNKLGAELSTKYEQEFKEKNMEFKFTDEQRKGYTTIGGAPFLDGEYTVFGEVIDGLDAVDKIANANTDENDRPVEDITVTMKVQ